MKLELIKLVVGTSFVIVTVILFYRKSSSKKSLSDFILSKMIKLWGKVVNLLILLASIWIRLKFSRTVLGRILE